MDQFLERIVAWARGQPAIRAALLTGSTARDPGGDGLGDLDIAIFATDITRYTASDDWMAALGAVWLYLPLANDPAAGRYPTRLVIFAGGQKVDFTFSPVEALARIAAARPLDDLYNRGYRVLLDKDGLTAGLPPPTGRPAPAAPPTEASFLALVNEFWFEAYHVPTYLARDELWLAKRRDWALKELLLRMLEWAMRSQYGWDYDTRYLGKDVRQWLDPDLYAALPACFGRLDRRDSWGAYFATAALFHRTAQGTARRLGYPYPDAVAAHILGFATRLRDTSASD